VRIDATGRPTEVTVDGCPKVFHEPVRDAMMKWRWHPPPGGVEATTTISVILKP
jgi:hypothetical protein